MGEYLDNDDPADNATDGIATTGIAGLDLILDGGFRRNRLYLIEGAPGSGKTTLAMQFLLEGARRGESVLYVTLSETEDEMRSVSASHGWALDGVTVHELVAAARDLVPDDQYTMFHADEAEWGDTTRAILDIVERLRPTRVAFDSLSELQLLAGGALRYRRQILALKQFFAGRQCTVLVLDDMTSSGHDMQVQSIAHGVLRLEQVQPEYGAERRRLLVQKYRGVRYLGGRHDCIIRRGGLEVFPRLVAQESTGEPVTLDPARRCDSGIAALDSLLGGGLDRGTSTLIVGAPGTGKSTLAMLLATRAADRGEFAAIFLFDESEASVLQRADGLSIGLRAAVAEGRASLQSIDPAELAPGQFVHAIRAAVEVRGASVVVIDSLNGYLNAMPGERSLVNQLHELFTYLRQRGVCTLLISAQQNLVGSYMGSYIDASYLADAVLLLRYYETEGELRQALSVLKKRTGPHERSIRELRMHPGRIEVGPPLRDYHGVMTGVPRHEPSSGN